MDMMSKDEREQLAQALEEAAAQVRAYPPARVDTDIRNDVEPIYVGPPGPQTVWRQGPELRAFRIEW